MKLSVVMPVYNEKKTVEEVIRRVLGLAMEKELVIVDDASTDGTREILARYENTPHVRIFYHEKNQGKGAALQTGFRGVTGDLVVIQDADLEYDPKEYPDLLEPILDGRADVVYGSRFLGGPHRVLYYWHYVGNCFLTMLSNMLSNINLTDMETCYKAFRREVLDKVEIRSRRFGCEPEFTMKVAKHKFRIYEVPISYSGRSYEEGKKITWKDGLAAIFTMIYYRFFD
ncbi:MAG TPA: glycosyltransferase family 2 protein [Candidatus Omnitrophota bacterium]|jgi:glycosyltransferase involved in cell wall biosynthesis|nr:glycosyltransferase family 2 protein [Candidatus Omnitrophota bacterium]